MSSRPVGTKNQRKRPTVVVWTSLLRDVHKKIAKEARESGKSISLVLRERLERIYAA